MDSTIKEYLKEYYCFLCITLMNLDKPIGILQKLGDTQ